MKNGFDYIDWIGVTVLSLIMTFGAYHFFTGLPISLAIIGILITNFSVISVTAYINRSM